MKKTLIALIALSGTLAHAADEAPTTPRQPSKGAQMAALRRRDSDGLLTDEEAKIYEAYVTYFAAAPGGNEASEARREERLNSVLFPAMDTSN